jgi:hypothetical protein
MSLLKIIIIIKKKKEKRWGLKEVMGMTAKRKCVCHEGTRPPIDREVDTGGNQGNQSTLDPFRL